MLTLKARPRKACWKTIELGSESSLEVHLTPPTYEEFLSERLAVTTADAVLLGLNCITDWRGVFNVTDSGEKHDVPFNRDGLGSLIHQFAPALDQLLTAVRPLFDPVPEDREKKSVAPPAAATSTNPPSGDCMTSADSPDSAPASA